MISELFENIKVYGRYVQTNDLDGLKYWNNIKNFLLKSEQEIDLKHLNDILGDKWDIKIKLNTDSEPTENLKEIYEFVHDKLQMYGEEGDIENKSIDKGDWEKYHFALQLIRIPYNNPLNLLRLLQVGYNLGQLSKHSCFYKKDFLDYYQLNNLDSINSYINLSEKQQEILSSKGIKKLITNLNNFIFVTIAEVQSGGQEIIEPFYSENIDELTINNNDYRKVLYTGVEQQFVLMSINPSDDIKMEIHKDHDQFLRIEQGEGKAIINGNEYILKKDSSIIVPAGLPHQIINNGSIPLKLYTIYSPPEHKDKLVQTTNPDKLVQTNDTDKFKSKYLNYKNKYIQLKKFLNK